MMTTAPRGPQRDVQSRNVADLFVSHEFRTPQQTTGAPSEQMSSSIFTPSQIPGERVLWS